MQELLRRIDRLLTREGRPPRSRTWLRWVLALTVPALFAATLDAPRGFPSAAVIVVLATFGLLTIQVALRFWRAGSVLVYLKNHLLRASYVGILAAALAGVLSGLVPVFLAVEVLVLLELAGRSFGFLTGRERNTPPAVAVILSFLVLIAAGTVILQGRGITTSGGGLEFSEALFTSTSAICVTGLSVIDVGSELSFRGQLILLVMIQLGGLGLMTLGAFVLVFLDKVDRSRGSVLIGGSLGSSAPGETVRLAGAIVLMSLVFEALGAVALVPCFEDLWTGIFCSVSAFCNAGFFPGNRSLEPYAGSVSINAVVMLLIVFGGLGFPVILEVSRNLGARLRRRVPQRLSVMSRLALMVSAILILAGAAGFYALERDRSLADLGGGEQALSSLFQSVTMRTAGFNTVPFRSDGDGAMAPESLLLTCGLMSIGASPLGTGGGFKTLTLAVLVLSVVAVVRGRNRVVIFRRQLAPSALLKAGAVFTLYAMTLFGVIVFLVWADGGRHALIDLVFEGSSALGTVGLSTGITGDLEPGPQLVLAVAMFLGRVGPLSFFLLFSSTRSLKVGYPEEDLIVG